MAGDTIIAVVGNLAADPELRFTSSGAAVANFTVASAPQVFGKQSGSWGGRPADRRREGEGRPGRSGCPPFFLAPLQPWCTVH